MNNNVYIILVNWNGWQDTIECLESVFKLDYPSYRVVVCDNASTNESVEKISAWAYGLLSAKSDCGHVSPIICTPVPKPLAVDVIECDQVMADSRLVIIKTGGNLGYAGGNNVGIRFAMAQGDCDFVWLLNNDSVVPSDSLEKLVARAEEDSSIGIVGSTVMNYERPEFITMCGGGVFSKYFGITEVLGTRKKLSDLLSNNSMQEYEDRLTWISGSSMLITKKFLIDIGLLEERYFLYYEEHDLAMRASGKFKLAYAPDSLIFHKGGASTGEFESNSRTLYYSLRAKVLFYKKFMPSLLIFAWISTLAYGFKRLLQGNGNIIKMSFIVFGEQHLNMKAPKRLFY